MVGRGHGIIHPLEVAETVLEVADVAWSAVEHCRHLCHHGEHGDHGPADNEHGCASPDEELAALCSENRHLRSLLEQNLKLLQQLSQSPYLLKDCPPDLYTRLIATVDSKDFLTQLESLHQESRDATSNIFPFKEVTGDDLHSVEILINVDQEEPSWWVWVTDEMITEEWSGIDNESYVIVSEEHVVEGVANFIAKCIVSNPKAKRLSPEQLQKRLGDEEGDWDWS
uniref:Uncharacterized protein n=1 Tax=Nelumbo nucifera TaxID=4432 RepID=A0A822XSH2_NELNU|nr:TPA_asm: hypothetical protein HUJ06_026018 [Nelumbo nucifera]